jgi:hypothetical protein
MSPSPVRAKQSAVVKALWQRPGHRRKMSAAMKGKIPGPLRHGHASRGSRTYRTWKNMHVRCANPNASSYSRYGGRGITVCERWQDFRNFLRDMGERPLGMSLT